MRFQIAPTELKICLQIGMPALTEYATNVETVPKKSKTSAASRKPAKPASRRRSTTAKKTKPAKSVTPRPTEEEVRLRAYFIAERRNRLALPGDASSDWLEARRQLLSEVGPR
jgi:Protein of unknown function (DUF2934)